MPFMKKIVFACLLATAVSCAGGPAVLAAPNVEREAGAEAITFDFKDIELPALIKTVSDLTGKNFLYDDSVKGKVTIISPETMTLEEIYQLFLTVLNVNGYTLVPEGKVNKIVSTKTARQEGLPVLSGNGTAASGQFVTRLVRLKYLDASTVAKSVLAPLMPATGNIITYPPTNTLILTDSAATIERMMTIMRLLDEPDLSGEVTVIPLLNANAEEVAQICNEMFAYQEAVTPTRQVSKIVSTAQDTGLKIIPYARVNALIVLGSIEHINKLNKLVALLDQKASGSRPYINVYYLENADAETLATTLNQLLAGIDFQSQTGEGQDKEATGTPSRPVTVMADKPTNSIVINAQPTEYALIKEIIRKLDVRRKQVYVEALILELSMDATRELGASLQGGIDAGSDSVLFGTSNLNTGTNLASLAGGDEGYPSLLGQTIEGIMLGGLFNPITVTGVDGSEVTIPAVSALIDLSSTTSDVNILSVPRLLTSDNEEAEIIVGSNVPVITERLTDGSSLSQSVSVERQDVALTLRFTPQVIEGDLVRLNVYQEVTDLASNSVGNINEVGPTLTKRVIRNTVLAHSKRTIVLGGLIGRNIQEVISKVPLLGDIPVLNFLFKRTGKTETKTNLLVFITPTIINSPEDLFSVTLRNKEAAQQLLSEQMRALLPEVFTEEGFPEPEAGVVPAQEGEDR